MDAILIMKIQKGNKVKDVVYISKSPDYRYDKNTIEIYITYNLKCKGNGFCDIVNYKVKVKNNICNL